MKTSFFAFLLLVGFTSFGQDNTRNVLFLGNSYTAWNNLPLLTATVAASAGDTLLFASNTPGGTTLEMHLTNTTSLNLINQGSWDYVVLQEQSQLPSFPDNQVEAQVFPYAEDLNQIILAANPCTETVFFMTWGRKNGDASNCAAWPPVCTYEGMDSLLNLRYRMMAEMNEAIVSPVGAVWRYIREEFPQIELYTADESHPSEAGSYAAACTFYSVIFRTDPLQITYDFNLSFADAESIRIAVNEVVYGHLLEWHIGEYDPKAMFSYQNISDGEVEFVNESENATDYKWDFGDGLVSAEANPVHTFTSAGEFFVELKARACEMESVFVDTLLIDLVGIDSPDYLSESVKVYPNPVQSFLNIQFSDTHEYEFYISDALGRIVLEPEMYRGKVQVDVSSLTPGSYWLITGDGRKEQRKFMFIKD